MNSEEVTILLSVLCINTSYFASFVINKLRLREDSVMFTAKCTKNLELNGDRIMTELEVELRKQPIPAKWVDIKKWFKSSFEETNATENPFVASQ